MQNELKRPPAKPFPTLLTKADAMMHAAEILEKMVGDLEFTAILADVLLKGNSIETGDEERRHLRRELETIASGIIDKGVQVSAMRAAIAEIRAVANETKLSEARAASAGMKVNANG